MRLQPFRFAAAAAACLLVGGALAAGPARGGAGAEPPGSWPSARQNRRLTAFQPMPGRIRSAPAVLARLSAAASAAPLHPFASRPGGSPDRAASLAGGALRCHALDGKLLWEIHPEGLNFASIVAAEDLDGDGRVELALTAGRPQSPLGAAVVVDAATGALRFRYDVEPISYSWFLRVDRFLPGVPGKQLVVVMHGYPPDPKNGYVALFDFPRPGEKPRRRWRYDFHRYTSFPSLLTADVDGDGDRELCLQTHSRMWILEAGDGSLQQFVQWDVAPANVRSYGLVRFQDLNGDGREDFFCIATFAQHHEVLLNEGGRLKQAWAHGWDESVTTGKVATIWAEPPIADVDGDGKLEMVLSMFHAEGEPRWMVRVYDAVTGRLEARLMDRVATDVVDVDGDGAAEILAEVTTDPARVSVDAMALYRRGTADPGGWREIWREQGLRSAALPPGHRQGAAAPAGRPVLLRGGGGDRRLAWTEGRGVHLAEYAPPAETGPDLSRVRSPSGALLPPPLAADLDGDGRNEVVLHHAGRASVYSCDGEGGFALRSSYPSDAFPVAADLDGDGRPELVVGTASAAAPPRLRAERPGRDRPLWEVSLPAAAPGLPHGRPLYLQAGRFTGRQGDDLYVLAGTPVLRSLVLDGRSGRIIWEKSATPGLKERHFGPTSNHAAAWDLDGDGREDLLFTNPDYYCAASGPTGDLLVGPAFPPRIFNQPSQGLYTLPALLENREGEPTVCLVDGHYFQAAMTARARPYWHRLPPTGEAPSGAEGFLRLPDGQWLLGFGRQDGRFACVEALTGRLRWEMRLAGAAGPVSACDIDGDGRPEFLFGTSHGELYAVGDGGKGPRLLWKARLPASVGMPVPADVDGDGRCEILAATGDGDLCLLGERAKKGKRR